MPSGRFTISLFLLCLLAPTAWATSARVNALGGGGEFFEDDYNVQRWYGSLVDYPDRFVLDSGHFNIIDGYHDQDGHRLSGPSGSLTLGLDRWRLPGVFSAALYAMGDDVDSGGLYRDGMRTTLALLYGVQIKGVNATATYRRGTDNDSDTDDTGTWTWERSRTDFGLGLRFDLTDGAYLDLAAELRQAEENIQLETLPPTNNPRARSWFDSYNLRARAFVRLSESSSLVPVMEYIRDDQPTFFRSEAWRSAIDGRAFKLGAGLNHYPDPDHLVLFSADYIHGKVEDHLYAAGSSDNLMTLRDWDALRVRLALESVFLSWITLRSGLTYEYVDGQLGDRPRDLSGLALSLGAAVHAGDWDLDLSFNDVEPRATTGYLGHTLLGNPGTWLTAVLRRQF